MHLKTNYVLIDYENVQPEIAEALAEPHFKVMVFVGANQARIDVSVATALQALGSRAQYIRISGSGRNALDFHIAYYLGRLAREEPEAYFHLIALDKGYDPLLEHLRGQGIHASRLAGVKDIPILKSTDAASEDDKLSLILANLIKRGPQRPASLKTLSGSVAALFQKKLTEKEVQYLLDELRRNGVFVAEGNKVTYSLPD